VDKTRLFQLLSDQDNAFLLDLLRTAYEQMNPGQRHRVFADLLDKLPPAPDLPSAPADGAALLEQIEDFRRESLAGVYYEPFNVNSKNWMHIPKRTKKWFARLGDLLQASCRLTAQQDHPGAVVCFGLLYELIDALERGKEIVFGDEIGSWMIPGDAKQYVAAYLTSLATTATPEEFTAAALPLIRRDSWQSFADQVYPSAVRVANEAQRAHLEAEIQHQNVRTAHKH
jgi:hypothetical protein